MPSQHVRLSQNHMATTFDFLVSCDSSRTIAAEAILRECHRLMTHLERVLSEFQPESPVYQLNHSACEEKIPFAPEALALLKKSLALRKETNGAFDPFAKSALGAKKEVTISETGEVMRACSQTHLGFGAIGKGYALEKARDFLAREGFVDYVLSAGGSSLVISGFKNEATPWAFAWNYTSDRTVGLEFKHRSGLPIALGVSGTHEKGNHILGVQGESLKSAFVALPSATEADALSTALFASGWEETMRCLEARTDRPAMAVINEKGIPRWNGIFQSLWGQVVSLSLILLPLIARADEEVNLEEMGVDDFTPYSFDRNGWWVLLPLAMLLFTALHLKNSRPKRAPKPEAP